MKPAYLALMALSLVAGAVVRRWVPGPPLALSRWEKAGVLFGAVVGGAISAKLPYLWGDWDALASGRVWLEGGRTLTLGLLGGYLGVEVAKLSLGIKTKTGDALAAPLAVSIGIGRLACFVGGCCFGVPSTLPWAHDFGDGVARHPTQLYEALFHFACAGGLVWTAKRGWLVRQRVKAYLGAYFAYRFVTEWIRPELRGALGLTLYQWTSVVGLLVMCVLWVVDRQPGAEPSQG